MEDEQYKEEDIRKLLYEAMSEALEADVLERIKDEQDKITRQFLQREIDRKTRGEQCARVDETRGRVIFDSDEDFVGALRILGFSEEDQILYCTLMKRLTY